MFRPISLTLALLATVALASGGAVAEEVEWDQKKVAQLTKELERAIGQIQITARTADDPENAEARQQVEEDLKLLKRNVRQLGQLLAGNQDRKASWPIAKRCSALIQRTRRNAAETPTLPGQEENIARAEALIAQIGSYYGAEPPPVAAPPTTD